MAYRYLGRERRAGSIRHPLTEQAKQRSDQEQQGNAGFQHAVTVQAAGVEVNANALPASQMPACYPNRVRSNPWASDHLALLDMLKPGFGEELGKHPVRVRLGVLMAVRTLNLPEREAHDAARCSP